MTADLAAIALAEMLRRRAAAASAVKAGRSKLVEAEDHVRLWCSIAAWFGAVLPPQLRMWRDWQTWYDHAPGNIGAAEWRERLAAELARALDHAKAKAVANPDDPALRARAQALALLDLAATPATNLDPRDADHVDAQTKVAA